MFDDISTGEHKYKQEAFKRTHFLINMVSPLKSASEALGKVSTRLYVMTLSFLPVTENAGGLKLRK